MGHYGTQHNYDDLMITQPYDKHHKPMLEDNHDFIHTRFTQETYLHVFAYHNFSSYSAYQIQSCVPQLAR